MPWVLAAVLSSPEGVEPQPTPVIRPADLRCEFRKAPLGIDAARPRLSWTLVAPEGARNQRQSAYRILVSSSEALLQKDTGDLWDSGETRNAAQNNVPYGGQKLRSGQICFWKVRVRDGANRRSAWSETSRWEMGLLSPGDWKAQWLNDGKPNPADDAGFYGEDPAPLFRKSLRLNGPIRRARLYVSGLGYYEASLNGQRVGDHVLDPGWTKFGKRVNYSTYDVAGLLNQGENCLGVALGNGWYNPVPMKMWGNRNLRVDLDVGRPRMIAQLLIEYRDGRTARVASDLTWKVGDGPILRNNVYLGEVYDARREQPGWDRVGFNDAQWRTPGLAPENVGPLVAQPQPPIRATSSWKALRVAQPKPGVFVYDMGENFAGWLKLDLDVPRGTRVRLRFGELQYPDGTLNGRTSVAGQIKSRGVGGPGAPEVAWQEDTYIAKGGGESYTPRFTFHGFRYVEVTGLPEMLPLSSVTALRLNSDVEEAGSFECSNPMLNEIQAMCRQTFLSNIFSVQSDCPHREKFGYGGDIAATSEALMANFDMAGFYAKAVRDWSDSALADGMFTDTAPFVGIQYCGVGWAMAHPLLISQLRRYYGDVQLEAEEYEAAKRWLLAAEKLAPEGLAKGGLSDHESLDPTPSPELVTPLYYQSARLLSKMAGNLGKAADEAYFSSLAETIRAAYLAKFFDSATGKVGPGTQTSQAFGLTTGIVPMDARPATVAYLLRMIAARNEHVSTGIFGTKFMLDELSRAGLADMAYRIVTQPDFPGWGWMLKNGATTLWEHWEISDDTFSHNHPMFGSVSEWMMKWLGGIQPADDAVGFDQIVIRPQTVPGLDWVKSRYRSIRGEIVSQWRREPGRTLFEVEVPVNCRADVALPASVFAQITESGRPLSECEGVSQVKSRESSVEFRLGSGMYRFVVGSV